MNINVDKDKRQNSFTLQSTTSRVSGSENSSNNGQVRTGYQQKNEIKTFNMDQIDEDSEEDEEKMGKIFCGIQTKKGVSCINLFYTMILQIVLISTYQLRLIFLQPMLEDSSQFGLSNDEGTHLQSVAKSISTFPKIIMAYIFGMLMDFIGRRLSIILALILLGLSIGMLPFSAPSFFLLYLCLILEEMFMSSLQSSPLLMDYAPKEAQGKAYSTSTVGMNLGVIVGAGIFVTSIRYFGFSQDFKPIFFLAGVFIGVFALLTPFMIIEPPDLKEKKEKQQQKEERRLSMSMQDIKKENKCTKGWKNIKKLLRLNYRAYRQNGKLFAAVVLQVLMTSSQLPLIMIFLNNWIYSFKETKKNPNNPLSYADCLFLIQFHNLVGSACTTLAAPLIGKYSDSFDYRISLSGIYIIGALSQVAMFLSHPGHWTFLVFSPLFHLQLHAKLIVIRSYAQRMFPIEIRSTLLGNIELFTAIMQLIWIQIYDYAFRELGSTSPFFLSTCMDVVLLILVFVLSSCGLIQLRFGKKKKQIEENQTKDVEHQQQDLELERDTVPSEKSADDRAKLLEQHQNLNQQSQQ